MVLAVMRLTHHVHYVDRWGSNLPINVVRRRLLRDHSGPFAPKVCDGIGIVSFGAFLFRVGISKASHFVKTRNRSKARD